MWIKYLRDTSPTATTCPTLYASARGTFVVQGKRVTEPGVLASFRLRDDETVVEVPVALLKEIVHIAPFPTEDGADVMRLALVRAVPWDPHSTSVSATSRGSFLVRGAIVIDSEALGAMNIPDDEAAVEVPRKLLFEVSADAA